MTLAARFTLRRGTFESTIDLTVGDDEVVAVLGPNGAGKSTLIRVVAGLEAIDDGMVSIDGRVLDDPEKSVFVDAADRGVGVVFQSHLLFDHLSVEDNVAFGLRARGVRRRESRAQIREVLRRFDLLDLAPRAPRTLSGGQSQRVALARALVTSPSVLLLDEPTAALDVSTRREVRRELRRHLTEYGGSTILVTHDPLDAYTLADRIVVLENGMITQMGKVDEITSRPRTRYVAELVGNNLVIGVATGTTITSETGVQLGVAESWNGPVLATIRPQAVTISRTPDALTSSRNSWPMRITGIESSGERARVHLAGPLDLVGEITDRAVEALGLRIGDEVTASVKATEIEVYER